MKKSKYQIFGKLLLFIIVFFALSSFIVDPDFGWHLALGKYMLEHNEILRGDVFSWTMTGYIWGNSYVLYEIVLAKWFSAFGYVFLAFLFGAIGTLGFFILSKEVDFLRGVMIVLGVVMANANLAVRPHVFSFLFFAALIVAIERKLYERPYFALISLFGFALWANLHRGFVYAICFFSGYLILVYLRDKKLSKWSIFSLLAMIIGTFATPYRSHVWSGGVADDFTTLENLYYVAEWFPTVVFFPQNIIFGVSGGVLVYIFFTSPKKVDPIWFILASFAYSLAFISVNLLSFWSAIFVFLVSRYFFVPRKYLKSVEKYQWYFIWSMAVLGVLGVIVGLSSNFTKNLNLEAIVFRQKYPVQALEFINDVHYQGNLFNQYEWGGYILWKGEGLRVFIDGRMAGWRNQNGIILRDYVDIASGRCGVLSKYKIDFVLVAKDFSEECFSGFNTVYEDEVAKVLLKT